MHLEHDSYSYVQVQGPAYYTFIIPITLCCSALKINYYAQEQEFWSEIQTGAKKGAIVVSKRLIEVYIWLVIKCVNMIRAS